MGTKTKTSQCVNTEGLLSLLRFARKKIHVRPPGLEDRKTTEWAIAVSRVLPEFDHWEGQPEANRKCVEASWDDPFDAANDVAKQEPLYGTVDIDSTAQHFKNMLIGYRDWILYDEDIHRFPSGGARDKSWRIGMEMAQRDLASKTLDRCR